MRNKTKTMEHKTNIGSIAADSNTLGHMSSHMLNGTNGWDRKMKKRAMALAVMFVLGMAAFQPTLIANAATNVSEVTKKFDTLLDIVTAIISSIGTIITLWGISEWGIAFQGQDGTMQAHSFKRIAGGIIMILAPQILKLLK